METISEAEWSTSFNGMCLEEADFMAQLLGNCALPVEGVSSSFWPVNDSSANILGGGQSAMYSTDETNGSVFSFSLGGSYSAGPFPSSGHECYYPFVNANNSVTMDYCMMDGKNNVVQGDDFLNQDVSNDSTESDEKMPVGVLKGKHLQLGIEQETPIPELPKEEMTKKRPRSLGDLPRSKKLKKCAKVNDNNEDNNNNSMPNRQSSSGGCSEDESNEANGVTSSSSGVLNLSGKTRASRGSATDPQSLYARKRRERINERLKILQNLVPNGTKVDISTMLEEAVQYVKFLQLQIKLLSSDELWMYAPLAYNGMDLGLGLMTPTLNPQS